MKTSLFLFTMTSVKENNYRNKEEAVCHMKKTDKAINMKEIPFKYYGDHSQQD